MKSVLKLVLYLFFVCMFLIPNCKAEENIVFEDTKYYKTIDYHSLLNQEDFSYTISISKEEFDNADPKENSKSILSNSATVETTYKKMTTTIVQNGSYYKYKNVLMWKNIPSTRSYDIIGIGFYPSVKVKGSTHFEQYYCYTSGSCTTTTTNYPQVFTTGAGTSFLLPNGNLSSLKQTFYFNVEKNTSATIIRQLAAGDYSHATSSISLNNSKKYSVNSNGILLNGSIANYYDEISQATAIWEGTW